MAAHASPETTKLCDNLIRGLLPATSTAVLILLPLIAMPTPADAWGSEAPEVVRRAETVEPPQRLRTQEPGSVGLRPVVRCEPGGRFVAVRPSSGGNHVADGGLSTVAEQLGVSQLKGIHNRSSGRPASSPTHSKGVELALDCSNDDADQEGLARPSLIVFPNDSVRLHDVSVNDRLYKEGRNPAFEGFGAHDRSSRLEAYAPAEGSANKVDRRCGTHSRMNPIGTFQPAIYAAATSGEEDCQRFVERGVVEAAAAQAGTIVAELTQGRPPSPSKRGIRRSYTLVDGSSCTWSNSAFVQPRYHQSCIRLRDQNVIVRYIDEDDIVKALSMRSDSEGAITLAAGRKYIVDVGRYGLRAVVQPDSPPYGDGVLVVAPVIRPSDLLSGALYIDILTTKPSHRPESVIGEVFFLAMQNQRQILRAGKQMTQLRSGAPRKEAFHWRYVMWLPRQLTEDFVVGARVQIDGRQHWVWAVRDRTHVGPVAKFDSRVLTDSGQQGVAVPAYTEIQLGMEARETARTGPARGLVDVEVIDDRGRPVPEAVFSFADGQGGALQADSLGEGRYRLSAEAERAPFARSVSVAAERCRGSSAEPLPFLPVVRPDRAGLPPILLRCPSEPAWTWDTRW